MRKAWLSIALVFAAAAAFGFQFYRQASQPTAFHGCYRLEGRKLVFGDGRLLIDGVDAGQFKHFKGDATKGPDRIALSLTREIPASLDLDTKRMLQVVPGGIQVPLQGGAYERAVPCS